MERQERRAVFRTHVDRRLRNQLRIFLVLFAIMLVLDVIRMIGGGVNPLWAIGAFIIGLGLGYALSRTRVLGWDASEQAVAASMTAAGAIILILYVVFILFKNKLVSELIHDPSIVGVVGLSLTAGAMFGNISFTLRGILRVLRLAATGTDGADQSSSSNATSST